MKKTTHPKFNSNHGKRRSLRLKGYDYSQSGAYFITICTYKWHCLFGEVVNGEMVLNEAGRIVINEWKRTAIIRDEIELDVYVVMPNHFHCIVFICRGDRPVAPKVNHELLKRKKPRGPYPKSIGSLVAGFKSAVTKRVNENNNTPGAKLWQRNYYEHIIRNDDDLNKIREYIIYNPEQWEKDQENPNII